MWCPMITHLAPSPMAMTIRGARVGEEGVGEGEMRWGGGGGKREGGDGQR